MQEGNYKYHTTTPGRIVIVRSISYIYIYIGNKNILFYPFLILLSFNIIFVNTC